MIATPYENVALNIKAEAIRKVLREAEESEDSLFKEDVHRVLPASELANLALSLA